MIARIVPMCESKPLYHSARSDMIQTVEPPTPAIIGVWRTPNVPQGHPRILIKHPGLSVIFFPFESIAFGGDCSNKRSKLSLIFLTLMIQAMEVLCLVSESRTTKLSRRETKPTRTRETKPTRTRETKLSRRETKRA